MISARTLLSIVVALAFCGCATDWNELGPEGTDLIPAAETGTDSALGQPGVVGSGGYALLVEDGDGVSIVLMDHHLVEVDRIQTDIQRAWSFAHGPDGFVLIDDDTVYYATEDDSGELFTPGAGTTAWRVSVDDGGDVDVAEENDMGSYSDDGVVLDVHDSDRCFMDVEAQADGSVLAADVWGPAVVTWTPGDESVEQLFTYDARAIWGTDILARDSSGRIWVAETTASRLHVQRDDNPSAEARSLGSIYDALDRPVVDVTGMTAASADSVYVVYRTPDGEGIAEVDTEGNVTDVMHSDGEIWRDLIRY